MDSQEHKSGLPVDDKNTSLYPLPPKVRLTWKFFSPKGSLEKRLAPLLKYQSLAFFLQLSDDTPASSRESESCSNGPERSEQLKSASNELNPTDSCSSPKETFMLYIESSTKTNNVFGSLDDLTQEEQKRTNNVRVGDDLEGQLCSVVNDIGESFPFQTTSDADLF